MNTWIQSICWSFCLLLITSPLLAGQLPAQPWQQFRQSAFSAPSPQQLQQASELFYQHLQGNWQPEHQQQWQQLGFEVTQPVTDYRVIAARPEIPDSHGVFIFNLNSPTRFTLQMPHSFSDLDTGTIGRQLFDQGHYRAAAWNTTHRKTADMAHHPAQYFNMFNQALSRITQPLITIQLHGFAADKRRSFAGRHSDLIISASRLQSDPVSRQISQCLQQQLPDWHTRLYPDQVRELGGTQNINAHQLYQSGSHHFIHLEISRPLRKQLLRQPALRTQLHQCLLSAGKAG